MAFSQYANVSGVYPHLALSAELGPPRTECGVGAMMAWAASLTNSAFQGPVQPMPPMIPPPCHSTLKKGKYGWEESLSKISG